MKEQQLPEPQTMSTQPNVLILVADDQGWNDVSYHNAQFQTPAIDRIAAEGVEFDRFYTPPLCTPCRAALLTGRDPLTLGVAYSTLMPWFNYGVAPQEHFMPQSFKEAGYQTAMIGKWHLGHTIRAHHPNSRGFDHFWGHLHTQVGYFDHEVVGGHDLQRNGKSIHRDGEYETFLAADEAIGWLKNRNKNQPFFLYVPFIAPHTPLEAPQELIDKYAHIEDEQRRTYVAMVDAMDQGIGRILDTLDEEGITDDTIVLFFSDNGGSDYGRGDNSPLRGWKGEAFEGGIRVPAVMRWPGKIEAGHKIDQVTSVMDMFPTLTTMAGITPQNKKPFDGTDMWQTIQSGEVFTRNDDLFFISDDPWRVIHAGVIHGDWKLIQVIDQLLTTVTLETYLFNLSDDPLEQTNLAEQNPEMVADLAIRIHEWRSQHPMSGIHCQLVPHPGWRGPYDWAEAMQAYDGFIDEAQEDYFCGGSLEIRDILDQLYGERGRLKYK